LNHKFDSTAAGLYQIIHPTFVSLCKMNGYSRFDKRTQDAMAIDLIAGKDALAEVDMGEFANAVKKCSSVWASLPGGDSGQHENRLALLSKYFTDAGGVILGVDNDNPSA